MESCEVAVLEHNVSCNRAVASHHVDHAVGQPGGLENFHDHLGAVNLGVAGFPNHDISHQGSNGRQVARNGGKIERGDRKYESFQSTVFQAVPYAVGTFRLFCMDLLGVVGVETKKIGKLTCRVDFSLEAVFSLRQHGCCVDLGTVRSSNQVGGLQKHCGPMLPWQGRPCWASCQSGRNGRLHMTCVPVAEVSQDFPMLMRGRHGTFVVGAHLVSSDVHGHLDGVLFVHLCIRPL